MPRVMLKVDLIIPTPDGSRTIPIESDRTSFGRGSEAQVRFADDGLSRLHASVYRDGDRIWVVDENSSNGTFVNGRPAADAGTPLQDGDVVRIGHTTELRVKFSTNTTAPNPSAASAHSLTAATAPNTVAVSSSASRISLLPIVLIAAAILFVTTSVVFIGVKLLLPKKNEVVINSGDASDGDDDPAEPVNTRRSPTPTPTGSIPGPGPGTTLPGNSGPVPVNGKPPFTLPAGKTYLEVSDTERRNYLRDRSMRIAQVIGNSSSDEIPEAAIDKIKAFTDAYAKRASVKAKGGCGFGDNLQATYERASKNAPFILKAFNEKGIDPRIGLYLAMIESEHCVCLQSPTGPLGMFQFTKATGELHGLKTVKGASPNNPDERCEPEPSARAAASYMKALTGRYGTGPSSVPLAIGSYNSGEGGLSSNLVKALESNSGLPRDFWTLISKGEILSKQFQSENFKYVPKFFAAAIVGENPQDFGLKLQPLSSYSQ
jgi:hypothetical protein